MSLTRRAVVVSAAAAALAACSAPAANKSIVLREVEVADAGAAAVDKTTLPDPVLPIVWPLTGVATEKVADRPAMSVKIENSSAARPQTGLGDADVVWEEMVEGGITRFNAVFHSKVPGRIGPIRSLRPMDAAISGPFGGLFVFSGGQSRFVSQVAATGLTMLSHDGGSAGFSRSGDRVAPHNVYGDTATFLQAGDGQGPPKRQFRFARYDEQVSARTGKEVRSISLRFPSSTPSWSWKDDAWQRSESGSSASTTDGGRIAATNVVVLRVEVRNSGAVDPAGNPVPETVLTGSGKATVFSHGRQISATWSKKDVTSVLTLTTDDDEHVLLAPGNVWVELLPVSGSTISTS